MANRAYLFTHSSLDFPRRHPEDYYDSRHSIPIAWFFFFDLTHIRLDRVEGWFELRCAAAKTDAISLYRSRRQLLQPFLVDDLLREWSERIVSDIARRAGSYLLLESSEVTQDDERDYEQFLAITRALEDGNTAELQSRLKPYNSQLSQDPEQRLGEVFGYTYS
jgi:hypothetical protein